MVQQIVRMETSNCFEELISINWHWNISEFVIYNIILLLKKVFKKVKCSREVGISLDNMPAKYTTKENGLCACALRQVFVFCEKGGSHGVLCCSQTWEWGQLYVLQVHNCPLRIWYTLHKSCIQVGMFQLCQIFLLREISDMQILLFSAYGNMGDRYGNKQVCCYFCLLPFVPMNNSK